MDLLCEKPLCESECCAEVSGVSGVTGQWTDFMQSKRDRDEKFTTNTHLIIYLVLLNFLLEAGEINRYIDAPLQPLD